MFSISSASDTFTIFLFSYFSLIFSPRSISNELKLYYYLIYCTLLSIKYWWSHEEIVHTFLSSFLSFTLLDLFQINLSYIITLPTALSRQLNICRHIRRQCLPLFILLCFMFLDWSSFGDFSSNISLLAHLTGVSALIQRFGWDDQYCYFIVPVSY